LNTTIENPNRFCLAPAFFLWFLRKNPVRNFRLRNFHFHLVDRPGKNDYDKGTLANPAAAKFRRYIIMKLGEKLQQLRKKSGLSQEQLAAQITVSRQAVSKWELDETMPDTDNVVQLSRLFGVSCDYLLRDEVDEPGSPAPAAPGEARPAERGRPYNASVLALAMCSVGLVAAYMGRIGDHTLRAMIAGFAIQILGLALFELTAPRARPAWNAAHLDFYPIACWLVLPIPVKLILGWVFDDLLGWQGTPQRALVYYFTVYLLVCAAASAALLIPRWRQARKKK